ncbi:MAG: glycosyltransferase [Lachnospiraceae bacterium]|nr:glycosyltransferase [Lachnospiraceae bacterium]
MSRRVLFFVWQAVNEKPPCVTQILALADMGTEVAVLTRNCSDEVMQEFRKRNIPVEYIRAKKCRNHLIQKAENYLNYRRRFRDFFRKYRTDDSILWVGSEQGVIRMWPFIRNIHPMVLDALEFYEEDWYQKGMRKIAPQVDVLTACELHRAAYMKDWWKLGRTPYVLPNKPYIHPRQKNMEGSTPELRAAIDSIRGKKTLLYQGGIGADRDLSLLAQALKKADSPYYLVLSGRTEPGAVEKIQEIYERTIYLGVLPAPLHLELMSHATICVCFYKDNCINNRYCAPNKIYEYAGFGIPMLCNDIPGLTESVGQAGAAECVNFSDPDAIIAAIGQIEGHYGDYCRAAEVFYDATDITELIREVADDAFSRTEAEKRI